MAQTTLERFQAARDAAASDVGDLENQIADRIALAVSENLFPDGLTPNLQRAYAAALSVGPELAPRPAAPSTSGLIPMEGMADPAAIEPN